MATLRRDYQVSNLLHWAVLFLAAALLVFLTMVRTAAASDTDTRTPGLLPVAIDAWSDPMQPRSAADRYEDVLVIREAMRLHRQGSWQEALKAWNEVELRTPHEAWKHVAIAVVELHQGNLSKAGDALDQARYFDSDNPVVHYYTALLRLEQAENAMQWMDSVTPGKVRWAVYNGDPIAPNTRAMYRLAARMELHKAIDLADRVNPKTPLIVGGQSAVDIVRLGDLLTALGADQFEADANHVLGGMYLESGWPRRAEQHLDQAGDLGVYILRGYQELGDLYSEEGNHGDALRAYSKALQYPGGGTALPAKKFGNSLRKAILGN